MPALTPKSLGLARVWTGLGPRDFAYRGRGYSIEPVTHRFWRLITLPAKAPVATAGNCRELLVRLSALLEESQDVDQPQPPTQRTKEDRP